MVVTQCIVVDVGALFAKLRKKYIDAVYIKKPENNKLYKVGSNVSGPLPSTQQRQNIVFKLYAFIAVLAVTVSLLLLLQNNDRESFINKFETNCTERGGRVIHDGNEFLSAPSTKTSQRIIAMCVNNGKIIE